MHPRDQDAGVSVPDGAIKAHGYKGGESRSTLFSGCAIEQAGAPARQATIALARALDLELWEAAATGCCGARADRRVNDAAVRLLVAPLREAAGQGLAILCLSPACCRVVMAHASSASLDKLGQGSAIRVVDTLQFLTQDDGLKRLTHAVRMPLYSLRVASHGVCHGDHAAPRGERRTDAVPPADSALVQLITAAGAAPLQDVSIAGKCADIPLVSGTARIDADSPAPACLTLAASAGADLLVTPCFLCFGYLNDRQRRLDRGDPARSVPVLHLSQMLGLACGVAPSRLVLERLAVPSRRLFAPFIR
ncbi:MAG TPA: heterodisulfide reductase-related iron-sulfur binding cluster [Chloroflexota bacterium]